MTLIERQAPSHWYLQDGRPFHEIANASGTGNRPVTLRDARKVLAFPSVTNVLGVLAKPGLDAWKIEQGIMAALDSGLAPVPSATFTRSTFDFLGSGKSHTVAAALALGREHVIPSMFRAFLSRMAVTEAQAPSFHYYLNRHVHLDEDFHAPMSLRLLAALCGDDADKWREAEAAAEAAVNARMLFWDGVLKALPSQHARAA